MSSNQVVDAIDRFFLDLIGTVIPGLILIVGTTTVLQAQLPAWAQSLSLSGMIAGSVASFHQWVSLLAAAYVLGHFLVSFGDLLVSRIVDPFVTAVSKIDYIKWLLPKAVKPRKQMIEEVESGALFLTFVERCTEVYSIGKEQADGMSFSDWRNIALSSAVSEGYLATRFMFLSLLNLCTGTALIIISVLQVYVAILLGFPGGVVSAFGLSVLLVVISVFFIERHYSFYRRSQSVPFSQAFVKLSINNEISKYKVGEEEHGKTSEGIPK